MWVWLPSLGWKKTNPSVMSVFCDQTWLIAIESYGGIAKGVLSMPLTQSGYSTLHLHKSAQLKMHLVLNFMTKNWKCIFMLVHFNDEWHIPIIYSRVVYNSSILQWEARRSPNIYVLYDLILTLAWWWWWWWWWCWREAR